MKIGFVTAYSAKHPAGLERCTLDLLKAVLAEDRKNQYIVYVKKGSGLRSLLSQSPQVRVVEVGWGKLWKDFGLFFSPAADVYVFNGPQAPVFFSPKNYLVIVYDFGYRQFRASGLRSRCKTLFLDILARLAFRRSQKILAISDYTKGEVVRLFGADKNKIQTLHLGFADFSSLSDSPVAGLPEKFFLFVGTLKQRKNPLNVIRAFAIFCKTQPGYNLVLAGKPSQETAYHQRMTEFIQREHLQGQVRFLGRASDGELAWLYRRAAALVFPSFLEGFGFPVLEAANCGLPVITSNQGSLKEIAGDAALLVNPADPVSIAQAMSRISKDPSLRETLIEKGRARAKQFSWEKTANQFIEVLKTYNLS